MGAPSPDYETVRELLLRGQRLKVDDVARICGRSRVQAQVLLGNLKGTGYARVAGKVGRQAVYVADVRLTDGDGAWRAGAARGPQGAGEQAEQMTEGLRRLMRAMRIGFPPKNPTLKPRQVYGKSGLHGGNDPEEIAA